MQPFGSYQNLITRARISKDVVAVENARSFDQLVAMLLLGLPVVILLEIYHDKEPSVGAPLIHEHL